MATVSELLDIAIDELGTKESPAGSNRTKYGAWFGLDGNPWCMMFVQWVFAKAGVELPVKTASCGTFMRAARASGQWVTGDYQPGDVVIYDFPGGAATDHCGIVTSSLPSGVRAIEGNTSTRSDSNGGTVMERYRPADWIVGAYRPQYEEENDMFDISALTDEQVMQLANRMQTVLAKRTISATLANELEQAKAMGITDGSSPYAFCTRAQAAVMAKRAAEK